MARVTGFRGKFNPRQPRDNRGRWKKAGAGNGAPAARKSTAASSARVSKIVGSVPTPVEGKSSYYTDRKNDFTAAPTLRSRAKRTLANRKVSAVPYARVSPRSVTAGVNAGTPVGRSHRLVAGGYIRVERTNVTKTEQNLKKALEAASPLARVGLAQVMKKQVKLPKGATGRIGTSSSGLPSIIIQKGYSNVPNEKRVKAISDFNEAMARRAKGKKVKGSRPQRRKKNPSAE